MYYFIVNPKSRTGLGKVIWSQVKKELDKLDIEYKVYFTHYEYHAKKLTKNLCIEHPESKTIVVLGGDGTLNEVINGITDFSKVTIGYIPTGSSNDFARSQRLETNPLLALHRIIKAKKFRYIDYGILYNFEKDEERKFIVSAGIGFDAAICYSALVSKIKKVLNRLHFGKLTYAMIAIKQIIINKPIDCEISVDNKTYKYKDVFFVAFMNQLYEGGGFMMAPGASPNDGKLSVCVIHDVNRLKALLCLFSLVLKKHQLLPWVHILKSKSLVVTTNNRIISHTDGEFSGRITHIKVTCPEEQVRFIV